MIRPDDSEINIEKENQFADESKAMDLDDLLEYIGDSSTTKGKKHGKAKGKKKDSIEQQIKTPKKKNQKKKNSSNSDKDIKKVQEKKKEKQMERSVTNAEDEDLIESFKNCLFINSAHSAFVTKEEPNNLTGWIISNSKN